MSGIFHICRLLGAQTDGVKDAPVEEDHDDTGDVEGAHGGVDEEV